MQPSQPEHTVVRSYLEWILDLPWVLKEEGEGEGREEEEEKDEEGQRARLDAAAFDVAALEAQLDQDHYGLGKVGGWVEREQAVWMSHFG